MALSHGNGSFTVYKKRAGIMALSHDNVSFTGYKKRGRNNGSESR